MSTTTRRKKLAPSRRTATCCYLDDEQIDTKADAESYADDCKVHARRDNWQVGSRGGVLCALARGLDESLGASPSFARFANECLERMNEGAVRTIGPTDHGKHCLRRALEENSPAETARNWRGVG